MTKNETKNQKENVVVYLRGSGCKTIGFPIKQEVVESWDTFGRREEQLPAGMCIKEFAESLADGDGDEGGSHGHGVEFITDLEGNVLYSHIDEFDKEQAGRRKKDNLTVVELNQKQVATLKEALKALMLKDGIEWEDFQQMEEILNRKVD